MKTFALENMSFPLSPGHENCCGKKAARRPPTRHPDGRPNKFEPGDKVVVVSDKMGHGRREGVNRVGRVYTVERCELGSHYVMVGEPKLAIGYYDLEKAPAEEKE